MSDSVGCSCSCHQLHANESRYSQVIERMGGLVREERVNSGISQRVLADRVGVSASFISQLENGKTHPSLTTLLVVADELGLSLDWLMNVEPAHGHTEPIGVTAGAVSHQVEGHGGTNGIWTNLDGTSDNTKFLYLKLEARQSWPKDHHAVQHTGREYGCMLSGVIRIEVGTSVYTLECGDAITFDARGAHRLDNPGNEAAHAIWFILEES